MVATLDKAEIVLKSQWDKSVLSLSHSTYDVIRECVGFIKKPLLCFFKLFRLDRVGICEPARSLSDDHDS